VHEAVVRLAASDDGCVLLTHDKDATLRVWTLDWELL
jgi:hypothetical protein